MSFMQKKIHSKKTNSNYSTTEMFINCFMLGTLPVFLRDCNKKAFVLNAYENLACPEA